MQQPSDLRILHNRSSTTVPAFRITVTLLVGTAIVTYFINTIAKQVEASIMSELQTTLDEVTTSLSSISTQLNKGFTEVTAKIDELASQAGDSVDPATVQALKDQVAALAGQAQALDDVVPDATDTGTDDEPHPEQLPS